MEDSKDKDIQTTSVVTHDSNEFNLGENINIVDTVNSTIIDIENQIPRQKNEVNQFRSVGFLLLAMMIIIYSSFIVCDIYYGLNDTSCVNQDVTRINLNLKTFLLVRGFILLGLIADFMLTLCTLTHSIIKFCTCIQLTIFTLVSLFLLAWNIIGATIFWSYMDNSKCSNPVYNYTFASLVIIFFGCASNLIVGSLMI